MYITYTFVLLYYSYPCFDCRVTVGLLSVISRSSLVRPWFGFGLYHLVIRVIGTVRTLRTLKTLRAISLIGQIGQMGQISLIGLIGHRTPEAGHRRWMSRRARGWTPESRRARGPEAGRRRARGPEDRRAEDLGPESQEPEDRGPITVLDGRLDQTSSLHGGYTLVRCEPLFVR